MCRIGGVASDPWRNTGPLVHRSHPELFTRFPIPPRNTYNLLITGDHWQMRFDLNILPPMTPRANHPSTTQTPSSAVIPFHIDGWAISSEALLSRSRGSDGRADTDSIGQLPSSEDIACGDSPRFIPINPVSPLLEDDVHFFL